MTGRPGGTEGELYNGTYQLALVLGKCSVTMTVLSQAYSETQTGDYVADGKVVNGNATGTLHGHVTFSGDLGFAMDCSATDSYNNILKTHGARTGECVFRDAKGTVLNHSFDRPAST